MATSDFRPEVEIRLFLTCAMKKYAIYRLFMAESPKFQRLKGNWGEGTRWRRQILDQKWKYGRFAHAQ